MEGIRSYQENPPKTLRALVDVWKSHLSELTSENAEKVAYEMVNVIVVNERLGEWENNDLVEEVFELVGDLELPIAHSAYTVEERPQLWERVKVLVAQLDKQIEQ